MYDSLPVFGALNTCTAGSTLGGFIGLHSEAVRKNRTFDVERATRNVVALIELTVKLNMRKLHQLEGSEA